MSENKATILVAGEANGNLRLVEAMLLPSEYRIIVAHDGEEALEKARETPPSVILDTLMPKMDGFEVARRLKEDETTRIIPVVMMTAPTEVKERMKALEAGADDFLAKPVEKTELQARVKSLLKVRAYNDHMHNYQQDIEAEVDKRTESIKHAFEKIKVASLDTVYRLCRAAEYKDEDTGAHIERMSHYSTAIARKFGCDEEFVENLLFAAPMHDIGKIGIPDRILQKPGKLEPDEWEIMKTHTTMGAEILKDGNAEFIKLGEAIAISHHEKWDGRGYPNGLQGADIPLAARIVALADVFDALTTKKRPYKPAFSNEKACSIIREEKGNHFDPQVVDVFFHSFDEINKTQQEFREE